MKKIKKALNLLYRKMITPISYVNNGLYMKLVRRYLKKNKFSLNGKVKYIHPTVNFDGSDYSLIHLGDGAAISRDVTILTHDFSVNTVYHGLNLKNYDEISRADKNNGCRILRPVFIGDHTFIGASVFICPGVKIGNNCLIGAGSVVRGTIPDCSVYADGKIICTVTEWLERKRFEGVNC